MQLPVDFEERTKPLLGDEWTDFVSAIQQNVPTSIRLNSIKYSSSLPLHHVAWSDSGYYLPNRPQFTFDPLFHAGCYYVQEASSMFIEQVMTQYITGDVHFLDLCAAPGGKSTLVASLLSEGSLLVSNEVIRSRAYILAENITKWGLPNVVVSNSDPAKIGRLQNFFDAILIDAPCSGEGMFRKDSSAIDEWSVDNVNLCKERQQRILADVWPALKPGGILIYSTCTYNKDENEDNVQWIRDELGAEVLPVELKEEWGISPSYVADIPAYHFFPHKVQGEGLFVAVLRKSGDEVAVHNKTYKEKAKDRKTKPGIVVDSKLYLNDADSFVIYEDNAGIYAFPKDRKSELDILKTQLNIVSEGICLGQMKGKDFVPDQSLALSMFLNKEAFDVCDVDWKTAISYLRKETLLLEDKPKGYILLTYKTMPIGFVKNIGNRANNLYPNEWRIRSPYIPSEEVNVL